MQAATAKRTSHKTAPATLDPISARQGVKAQRFPDRTLMDSETKDTLRKIDGKIYCLKQDAKKWQAIRDYIALGGKALPNDEQIADIHPALRKI